MGNDGGSIPTRRELVKEAERDPSATDTREAKLAQQEYYWSTDPISQKTLTPPIVSDSNGKLYNKETILEFLLEGVNLEDAVKVTQGSVTSIRDVVDVKFELNDEGTPKGMHSSKRALWKCPVTGDKLGPGTKAVYLVPCGHVFSASAVKEIPGDQCLTCDTEFARNDVIPIVPISTDDIARLSLRRKTLQENGLTHSLRKAPGSKKRKHKDGSVNGVADGGKAAKIAPSAKADAVPGIQNAATASLTAKVLQEQEQAKKQRTENENVKSLFTSKDQGKGSGKNIDFMTRGYTIPSTAKR